MRFKTKHTVFVHVCFQFFNQSLAHWIDLGAKPMQIEIEIIFPWNASLSMLMGVSISLVEETCGQAVMISQRQNQKKEKIWIVPY